MRKRNLTIAVLLAAATTLGVTSIAPGWAASKTTKKTTTSKKTTATTKKAASTTKATSTAVITAVSQPTATGTDTTPAIVAATNAFLATLTAEQKQAVQFEFSNTAQRQKWSNLPDGIYSRSGVMWGKLSDASKAAWLNVMKATLSEEGYARVNAEWDGDQALAAAGGGGPQYGKQYYWIAIIGAPSSTTKWQWQWGGHHVTVNATISGTEVALTPSFIGVQPATYNDASGKEVRPLGDIETEAFALVNSLDASQKTKAIIGTNVIDLVVGPGADGKTVAKEGLKGSDMTAGQKAAMLHILGHYGGLVNAEDGAARMTDLQSNLEQTYFAWSGPTTNGSGVYFRVAGPTVVAEYSGQSMGGNSAQHIHGIYRDPTNDYGAKLGAGLK